MKYKKRNKSRRLRGSKTHARGFKKKARGSGHRGGVGMAGTGKRADQKKTLILNAYGNDYFGKSKALRRGNVAKKLLAINVGQVQQNLESLANKGIIKLSNYKLLGEGDLNSAITIEVGAASQIAIDKVKKAGGIVKILNQDSENKKSEEKTKQPKL